MTIKSQRIGKRIRERRIELGLTQTQLGAPNYSYAHISSIESGRRGGSLECFVELAHRLDLPLEDLIEQNKCGCGVYKPKSQAKCWACSLEDTAAAWRKKRLV